jgi:hypothetical protein
LRQRLFAFLAILFEVHGSSKVSHLDRGQNKKCWVIRGMAVCGEKGNEKKKKKRSRSLRFECVTRKTQWNEVFHFNCKQRRNYPGKITTDTMAQCQREL